MRVALDTNRYVDLCKGLVETVTILEDAVVQKNLKTTTHKQIDDKVLRESNRPRSSTVNRQQPSAKALYDIMGAVAQSDLSKSAEEPYRTTDKRCETTNSTGNSKPKNAEMKRTIRTCVEVGTSILLAKTRRK